MCFEAKVRSSGSHALPYCLTSCASAPCAVPQGFAPLTYVYLCMRMYEDEPLPDCFHNSATASLPLCPSGELTTAPCDISDIFIWLCIAIAMIAFLSTAPPFLSVVWGGFMRNTLCDKNIPRLPGGPSWHRKRAGPQWIHVRNFLLSVCAACLQIKKKKITHCLLLGKLARANVCSDPRNVQQAGAFENNLLLRRSDTSAELQINLAPGFARMTTAALKCN